MYKHVPNHQPVMKQPSARETNRPPRVASALGSLLAPEGRGSSEHTSEIPRPRRPGSSSGEFWWWMLCSSWWSMMIDMMIDMETIPAYSSYRRGTVKDSTSIQLVDHSMHSLGCRKWLLGILCDPKQRQGTWTHCGSQLKHHQGTVSSTNRAWREQCTS